MNRYVRKLIAAIICIVIIAGVFPARSHAANIIAEGTCGTEDVWWTLTDDGVFTVSGNGDMIAHGWFEYLNRIKTVVIENGVTAICGCAFDGCTALTSVRMSNTVTSIGMSAFNNCTALKSITLPGSVTYIGNGAFSGCSSLTNISIPNSVTHIDGYAFARCDSLTSITIPDSVTNIGNSAFEACPLLKNVKLSSNTASIGDSTFRGCTSLKSVTIPGSVKAIGMNAFYYCPALESVTILDGVEAIGEYAFGDCDSLKNVNLPDSVKAVGSGAFSGCDSLETIKISKNLTSIEDYTFQSCYSLKDITIPDSVKSIGNYAFGYCTSLRSITIQNGVQSIGNYAFEYCTSLTDVTIPDSVTAIGEYAFENCSSLKSLTVPASVKTIRYNAFHNALGILTFLGDAPRIEGKVFTNDNSYFTYNGVIAFYPANNSTWTESVRKSFGDNIIWIPDNYNTSVTDSPRDKTESLTPASSLNIFKNNYNLNQPLNLQEERFKDVHPWAEPVDSHLIKNSDGSYTRVERIGDKIVIEDYDSSFKIKWKKTTDMELPIYGGFYSSTDYNFFVFGQENWEENNKKPVVRIVRYTKNWHRVDSVELLGANTVVPFEAGSLRFAEKDGILYIHTCHQIYTMDDGLNHQTNMYIELSIPYMKIVRTNYHVGGAGYVSHSFNQFILLDGDDIVRLDHGDAYPRAVRISRFSGDGSNCETADVLKICGKTGENATGVALGGFEVSGTSYLVAGDSVVQEKSVYNADGKRNIFITATDKTRFTEAEGTTFRWITSYKDSDSITVSNPLLTKINNNSFILMWEETDANHNSVLRYVYLDGSGAPASEIFRADYPISDCQPVVSGGRLIWYVTENSAPKFYSISLTGTPSYEKGDVDMSGQVGNSDLIMVARHVVHILTLTGEQFRLGDMDGDGEISNKDIISLARKIVGLN